MDGDHLIVTTPKGRYATDFIIFGIGKSHQHLACKLTTSGGGFAQKVEDATGLSRGASRLLLFS